MNLTQILNDTINISMDMIINPRYCEVLEVSLNYNLFVIINFVYFIIMFIEMKKEYILNLEKEINFPLRKTMFIAMVVFNVCMFLFQFALIPLTTMAGG